jgi:LemA protein
MRTKLGLGRRRSQEEDPVNRFGSRVLRLVMLAVLPLALAGCGVNAIPTKQEKAKAAFGDLQASYQRRADLVPNLVATVQAFAQQEHAVLTDVTQARARATQVTVDPTKLTDPQAMQRFQEAQNQLSGAIGRLLVVSERYPDLKSNQNFLALQSQLEGTENRINVARRDYNEAVRDYNTTLRVFPTVLWAKTLYSSAQPMQVFQATEAAQAAPPVNFNLGYGQPAAPSAPAPATTPAPAK